MKTPAKLTAKQPTFVRRAERALSRAARRVREENRRLEIPVLVLGTANEANFPAK